METYLETEVKFLLNDRAAIREQIIVQGAESQGRFFETNTVYDDKHMGLFKAGSLLRLRNDQKTVLTLKQKPDREDSDVKARLESEVEVSDFGKMNHILKALGLRPIFIYEKWRETFRSGDLHLCIDELPYGNFLEIEGKKENIRRTAEGIGLNWEDRLLLNYHGIFARIKKELNLDFADITFANFKGIAVNPAQYKRLLTASER